MSLANIWENLKELSEESRIVIGEDTYRGARAMRNYISHGYGGVDFSIVWETVHTNIPILDKNCRMLLELVCGCPLPCEFNKNDTKTCTKNTRYREGECVFK